MTDIDDRRLAELRAATPGCAHVAHFNNAGASLQPAVVTDTVVDFLRREATVGGYEAAADALEQHEAIYASIARLVNGSPHEVALIESATRAWDMAVYGYPFRAADRVLTGRAEYASNAIGLLQLRRRHDLEIVVIDDDDTGQIDLDALDAELDHGAAMVALTHVPTNGGQVNPAAEVGRRCRAHGVFYVLDACQSAGQLPLDVQEIGCDALSATGRKYLRGPRGTGFLWVRDEWIGRLDPPLLDLHAAEWTSASTYEVRDDARRFEAWEASRADRMGLGAAVDHALEVGVDAGWRRLQSLAADLRTQLAAIDRVTVRDKGSVQGGIVTFTVDGVEAAEVQRRLRDAGVNTSTTHAGHGHFDGRDLPSLVRASVHYYNTDAELDRLVGIIREMTS